MADQRLVELTVEALGAAGDGLASHEGAHYFIADSLPGDRVRARITGRRGDGFAAETVERLKQGPHRTAPACRHFNDCGGCAAQHFDDEIYDAWKRGQVVTALARRGLDDVDVAPLMRTPPGARRRATVHVLRRKHDAVLGFQARASHRIVAIEECPVLEPALAALLAPLGRMFADLLSPGTRVEALVTQAASGVDLLIRAKGEPDLGQSRRLIGFANSHDLARVSWRGKRLGTPPLRIGLTEESRDGQAATAAVEGPAVVAALQALVGHASQ